MRKAAASICLCLACACTNGRTSFSEPAPDEPDANGGSAAVAGTGSSEAASGSGGVPSVAGSGPAPSSGGMGLAGAGGAGIPASTGGFIRRSGKALVVDGQVVTLRGISFGNEVWTTAGPAWNDHSEPDFVRLQTWGMNAVRFCLNYATFEDDASPGQYKQTAWDWLDTNVAWAKAHHVYLLLNMHVPQGGFQPGADGNALWDVPANQDRLSNLWRAIAQRYAAEPIIAGYDLLNEPDVSTAPAQWQTLAARLVRTIREVDTNHLLVVERTNAVNQKYTWDGNMNWFLVQDENVMYTFHFYGPFTFTHQGADWAGLAGKYGQYPDPAKQDYLDRGGTALPRTKQYLDAALQQYAEFGTRNNVPILLGEFGAINAAFAENRGGATWVSDMVSVARAKGLNFIYHTYHEDNFGVFYGYGMPVDPNRVNSALLDVLTRDWK